MKLPILLTKSDMAARWGVSRQVVDNWDSRHSDFPQPVMRVSCGKLPLYLESDVLAYEKMKGLKTRLTKLVNQQVE